MQFLVTAELAYALPAPSTFILNLHALNSPRQEVKTETFQVDPAGAYDEFTAAGSVNRFVMLNVPKASALNISYTANVRCETMTVPVTELATTPLAQLQRECVPYLFPSRYCQSDRIGRMAWSKFGHLEHPYERVSAICDWIHENVSYLRGASQASTSACDTLLERAGVCRDFAHLGIAFCRALNLPARYATGYACGLQPPDMHAWFEVAIGGRWIVFDATRIAPLNGLVRVGYGQDAADASLATIFGPAQFNAATFGCVPADGEAWQPWDADHRHEHALVAEDAEPRDRRACA